MQRLDDYDVLDGRVCPLLNLLAFGVLFFPRVHS